MTEANQQLMFVTIGNTVAVVAGVIMAILAFMKTKQAAADLLVNTKAIATDLATKTLNTANVLAAKTEVVSGKVDAAMHQASLDTSENREAIQAVHGMLNSELAKWKQEQSDLMAKHIDLMDAKIKLMDEWKVQQIEITKMAVKEAFEKGLRERDITDHATGGQPA